MVHGCFGMPDMHSCLLWLGTQKLRTTYASLTKGGGRKCAKHLHKPEHLYQMHMLDIDQKSGLEKMRKQAGTLQCREARS